MSHMLNRYGGERHDSELLLLENERLITRSREARVRRETVLREADRKIKSGLARLRRHVLHVVSGS